MMKLREAREIRGLTQVRLAQLIGSSPAALSLQEAEIQDFPLDRMILAENELRTSITWPDKFTPEEVVQTAQALVTLAAHYPLKVVVDFLQKTLADPQQKVPIKTLRVYAMRIGGPDEGSLLPPGVK
jgi:transcriptional regulator with XRE-family HTH domain